MAADAAAGDLAFQQERGAVVRTSRAEIRQARTHTFVVARGDFGDAFQPLLDGQAAGKKARNGSGDLFRLEFHHTRKQRLAALVFFADNHRPAVSVVELVAQLKFQKAALLFDDENGFHALGELGNERRLEWKRHAEFRDANAQVIQVFTADAEIAQRLHQVVVG